MCSVPRGVDPPAGSRNIKTHLARDLIIWSLGGNSGGHKTRVFSRVRASVESANSLKINDDEF